jgi:hypothetical protein
MSRRMFRQEAACLRRGLTRQAGTMLQHWCTEHLLCSMSTTLYRTVSMLVVVVDHGPAMDRDVADHERKVGYCA